MEPVVLVEGMGPGHRVRIRVGLGCGAWTFQFSSMLLQCYFVRVRT